jgi:hypothetical protein
MGEYDEETFKDATEVGQGEEYARAGNPWQDRADRHEAVELAIQAIRSGVAYGTGSGTHSQNFLKFADELHIFLTTGARSRTPAEERGTN